MPQEPQPDVGDEGEQQDQGPGFFAENDDVVSDADSDPAGSGDPGGSAQPAGGDDHASETVDLMRDSPADFSPLTRSAIQIWQSTGRPEMDTMYDPIPFRWRVVYNGKLK